MAGQPGKSGGPRSNAGRTPGSKNKVTIERERKALEEQQREIDDQKAGIRKLPKDVLEQFMVTLAGMAAVYQPLPQGAPVPAGRQPDEKKFLQYSELAIYAAKCAAPFFHPTFKAITVSAPPDQTKLPAKRPGDDAKVIDINDPAVLMRTYQKMIASGD